MLRFCVFAMLLCSGLASFGEERVFDFTQTKVNEMPAGFRSSVAGTGSPGEWRVVLDDVPAAIPSLTPKAPAAKTSVLAQLAKDPTDEHFPLLIYDEESYGDFTMETRFKTVAGEAEQMAGIAFRLQDEKNYYYLRASSKGSTFRFSKVVNGQRGDPIGPEIQIPRGVWHSLKVECKGNTIRCFLNDKEAMPQLTDNSFQSGKIAFWTKSDSVSYFTAAKITYVPRVSLAKILIKEMIQRYPRVLKLKMFAMPAGGKNLKVVASTDENDLGAPGQKTEKEAWEKRATFYGKNGKVALVTMPLYDRNGEIVAILRVELKAIIGQTESNALGRALPIVRDMEKRIQESRDLF